MSKIINFIKKETLTLIGLVLGILGGYLYWGLVGCTSGNCPITSSPLLSALWGGIMGSLLLNSFKKETQ